METTTVFMACEGFHHGASDSPQWIPQEIERLEAAARVAFPGVKLNAAPREQQLSLSATQKTDYSEYPLSLLLWDIPSRLVPGSRHGRLWFVPGEGGTVSLELPLRAVPGGVELCVSELRAPDLLAAMTGVPQPARAEVATAF